MPLAYAEAALQRAADHFLPSSSESEDGSNDAEKPAYVVAPEASASDGERLTAARRSEHAKRKRKKKKCAYFPGVPIGRFCS